MKEPKLRFKADDGSDFPDWEDVCFGSLYEKNMERNTELEFDSSKTISIASMSFKEQGNGASEDSLTTYKVLRIGDIAFEGHENKEYKYGRFVLNDIGDGIMSPRFSCLRPVSKQVRGFWKYYIHLEQVMKRILVRATKKGTMMHELVIPDFLKQSIMVPSLPEQQKIADFLSTIDTIIEKQRATVLAWEERKKGVMQKLFSQEVRFKADDGSDFPDWEEKKLGDIGTVKMCKRVLKEQTSESGDVPFYKIGTFGGIPDAFISRELYEELKTKYSFPRKGNILLSAAGTIGRTVIYDGEDAFFQDSNIVWLDNDSSVLDKFLLQFYNQTSWDNIEGGTIKRLYNGLFLSKIIPLPSLPEQQKIADCLSALDAVIEKQKETLEKWQELKKGLLQQMFV